MPMRIQKYRTEGICKECGSPFVRKAPNQIFCPGCSYSKYYVGGEVRYKLILAEPRLKKAADESGNPKIWTAGECSQDFLRSLIPSRH